MLNNKKYRSILCLNGELPEASFFARGLPVIAADGAANKLTTMNITPDIIIGDLDSVEHSLLTSIPHLHEPDQLYSDFQKSLRYMQIKDLLPAIIVGVSGGYLDHVLNNVNVFLQTDSLIYAPPVIGMTIKSGQSQTLSLPVGTKISLIGLPQALVTTKGLKWELQKHTLTFPGDNSCFNRTQQDDVHIEVHEGNVLVLAYQQNIIDAGS